MKYGYKNNKKEGATFIGKVAKTKALEKKKGSHVATAKDRKKDSYLSADSRVYDK